MSSALSSLIETLSTAAPSPSPTGPPDIGSGNNGNGGNNGPGGGNGRNEPNTFYRNLFYILIGLLAAFGIISFLSLFRARHRRRRIAAEAARLGLLVPGMDGYIPIRERRNMSGEAKWRRADGRVLPDWWDVEKVMELEGGDDEDGQSRPGAERAKGASVGGGTSEKRIPLQGLHGAGPGAGGLDFRPLSIIPPSIPIPLPPPAHSDLPYFPHHLAYRPEDLDPLPTKFGSKGTGAGPDALVNLHELAGERLEVVTIIRMPGDRPRGREGLRVEEGEEVLDEWGGVCLGVMSVGVEAGPAQGPVRASASGTGR